MYKKNAINLIANQFCCILQSNLTTSSCLVTVRTGTLKASAVILPSELLLYLVNVECEAPAFFYRHTAFFFQSSDHMLLAGTQKLLMTLCDTGFEVTDL